MKTYIAILFLIFSHVIFAQKPLDTIYANENKNVALFFPATIRQGIIGANNYVFTYNRDKEQFFGLLQASPGMESNLLAVTSDGLVYSYILKYSSKLKKLNYFIIPKESIGNESPKQIQQPKELKEKQPKVEYFQKFSEYLLRSSYSTIETKREDGIKFQLQRLTYNASEVYLVFSISNKSKIDYNMDYLKVFVSNGNKKRKSSFQKLELKPIYYHKIPTQVKAAKTERFILVVPKFVISKNEKLTVELKEIENGRNISF